MHLAEIDWQQEPGHCGQFFAFSFCLMHDRAVVDQHRHQANIIPCQCRNSLLLYRVLNMNWQRGNANRRYRRSLNSTAVYLFPTYARNST